MSWLKKKKIIIVIFTLFIFLVISSCSTVPITGRKRVALLPAGNLATMALQSYKQLLNKSRLSTDREKVMLVKRVGRRIAMAAEVFMKEEGLEKALKNFKWEFNLIENNKVVNAFCMPGGKVAVYTGILPIAMNETGLAVIMGHEVAHAIAKHGNERMSQLLLVQLGGVALDVATRNKPNETRNLFRLAYGVGSQLGLLLPYSRTHESEADHIGLVLMASAGYDPGAAPEFWKRMAKKGGKKVPQFLSTHPAPEKRVERLNKLIPEVKRKHYRKK
ncbi:MAG: M48 family metallopeptidase [Acidobacteriota bacterium]